MIKTLRIFSLLIMVSIFSCQKENSTPPSVAQFTSSFIQEYASDGAKNIEINFSTPIQSQLDLAISISDSTAQYGKDYVTSPDGTSGTITMTVPKGAISASFSLIALNNIYAKAKGITKFALSGNPVNVKFGDIKTLRVSIVDDRLVCYLPMQGNAIDASYFANTTLVNGATLVTGHKSQPNTAYNFDGISNFIQIGNSSVLNTISDQITLTAWVKPSSFYGGNYTIIEKAYLSHTNPYYQYKLGLTGDQYPNIPGSFLFCLSINNTYTPLISPAGTWSPGNWYFVVGTYDGSNMILYVNGSQVAKSPMTGKIDHFGTDIYLGKVNNLGAYTQGTLGDIRIYNRALSASEISSLYTK